jgi:D-alanyl-D-alanine carboxypeptidase
MDKKGSNFFIKNLLVWTMLIFLFSIVALGLINKFIVSSNNVKVEEPKVLEQSLSSPITEEVKLPQQEFKPSIESPILNAKAYLVMDVKNDKVLVSENADMQLPPASLTKIMTAIIAMEEYNLSKSVVIPEKCIGLNGTSIGLQLNEVFTLEDLLYGLLVKSGADAACAIANISSEEEFLQKMNDKAKSIGLENTIFQNEIGLDAENNQLTSVNDIKKLSLYALKISTFRKIIGTKNAVIKNLVTGQTYSFVNTNDLLFSIPGTVGIKTGLTERAGQCLSYLYQNKDREIMIVILGSQDRFGDTKTLLNWANLELDFQAKEL